MINRYKVEYTSPCGFAYIPYWTWSKDKAYSEFDLAVSIGHLAVVSLWHWSWRRWEWDLVKSWGGWSE